ncbi:Multiple epidermal growth factor-like domains protein 8 [Mortierella polycephala]|uniref:Multiple epidermal growth factor-like domains protein 8 n=1 Tax=Mortierella polycephala TaxID=41804 RepID=A0A9P6Q6S0_9FUNG|nr:Multiple epidermal growth factor-like domains protein 8 [Mortierella polycephala]
MHGRDTMHFIGSNDNNFDNIYKRGMDDITSPHTSFDPEPSSSNSDSDLNVDDSTDQDQQQQQQQGGKHIRITNEELSDQNPYVVEHRATNYAYKRNVKIATTKCNDAEPQVLGPGWNGTFVSNSGDGIYPSESRTCTWTIQAMTNDSTGTGATKSPYIVSLSFWTPIQLVCGIDYLTIYDGPDTSSPVIAKLCGNVWMDSVPTLYSSGSQMTAVLSTKAGTPGSFGFTASWTSCHVMSVWTVEEALAVTTLAYAAVDTRDLFVKQTAGYTGFTPRSQHAMAYDASKDMVYITGGTSFQTAFMWDLLTYSFASNKWNKITVSTKSPDPRYGHFSFMYNNDLYIYGGISVIGGMADVWKFNGKYWTQQQPINLEKMPTGRVGPACVFVQGNTTAMLVVFGGLNAAGETMRDLHIYDIEAAMWKKADHQNSVGLSGATAVYHKTTESIYFFGGMVNQTTRNTVPYQYFIQQDLWHELPPRIDPLSTQPVEGFNQSPPNDDDDENDDDADDSPPSDIVQQYLPPVMYDPISGVWTPAGLMGDDIVVMYGGMRPFGLGINVRDQSCYVQSMVLYDLSCQRWTTYDVAEITGTVKPRVNHTMVMRPPGAPGGSKSAWTTYVFGGFDGTQHNDILNVTMDIPTPLPAEINNCRALRWCSLYDDCQNCNLNFCSYVNGLCLFDTDKAKAQSSISSAPHYLVGSSDDIPKNGTLQDLLHQRPDLEAQILNPDTCPSRIGLDIGSTYTDKILPGQEMTFKTYIDACDLDIQFDIKTDPTTMILEFKSLNVWEGFMNMYWRATHGLTDDSWDGSSWTSSPIPADTPNKNTSGDGPVITSMGVLNTSELMDRWTKYSGLDESPASSALQGTSEAMVNFLAEDPRRFSGYYIYSLKNSNPTAVPFELSVILRDLPNDNDKKGSKFDLAMLGFLMAGFTLGILLLVLLARGVRRLIEEREQTRLAAEELRMEEEEGEDPRRLAGAATTRSEWSVKDTKPMYRVVVGVQPQAFNGKNDKSMHDLEPNTLRYRAARREKAKSTGTGTALGSGDGVLRPWSNSGAADHTRNQKKVSSRSDTIRDLGSAPLNVEGDRNGNMARFLNVDDVSGQAPDAGTSLSSIEPATLGLRRWHSQQQQQHHERQDSSKDSTNGSSSLQRGWSLRNLGRSMSLKRQQSQTITKAEEKEGLTDNCSQASVEEGHVWDRPQSNDGVGDDMYDIEQEIIELDTLFQQEDLPKQKLRSRNPVRVQPISIEPVPFHDGLVPRTRRQYKRYQRYLARRRQQPNSLQRFPESTTTIQKVALPKRLSNKGSLQRVQRNASRLTLRSYGGSEAEKSLHEHRQGHEQTLDGKLRAAYGQDVSAQGIQAAEDQGHGTIKDRKVIRMRGRQEYEPGPLLAVNVLIVFPGDAGTRRVQSSETDTHFNHGPGAENNMSHENGNRDTLGITNEGLDQRLPPMAIGTAFVPDPVRWWAYRAQQQIERRRFERGMRRLHQHQSQSPGKTDM